MLAERLGFKVKMVECGNENIKLTTPNDIYIAEAILRARQEKQQ
jgi:2-C-methyl-D-erythritol 4-phosphate cytidylyltransferase